MAVPRRLRFGGAAFYYKEQDMQIKKSTLWATLAAAVILLMALVGCSSGTSTPAATVTVTATSEPDPVTQTPEEEYLTNLHALNEPFIENATDATLVELGHNICTALNDNLTTDDIISYLANTGSITTDNAYQVGEIIGAAVVYLCPQFSDQIAS